MGPIVECDGPVWSQLRRHLFAGDAEAGAFLVADWVESRGAFSVTDLLIPERNEVEFASAYHLHLSDDFVARAIVEAWCERKCLIEAHSHRDPHWPAFFSTSDLFGLVDLVPHIRWRMRGTPYASLVLTRHGYAGLAWTDGRRPTAIERIVADGVTYDPDSMEQHAKLFG